jgi:hypothetical protein
MRRDDRSGAEQGARRRRDGGQQIRVTVPLAGPQDIAIAAHQPRTDADDGSVSMRVGRVLMVFYDRPAVDAMVGAWGDHTRHAEMLPGESERSTPRASAHTASEPAILVEATGPALVSGQLIRPPGHTIWLQLQVGGVLFSVRDTAAFGTTAAALREVVDLARIVLPSGEPAAAPSSAAATAAAAALTGPPTGTAPKPREAARTAVPAPMTSVQRRPAAAPIVTSGR